MYKRYVLIAVVAVIALVLLWPDDEPPPKKEQRPASTGTWKTRPPQHVPWQLRHSPRGTAPQSSGHPPYSAPRQTQPAPAYPYTDSGQAPYAAPGQQPGGYAPYATQPQYPTQQPFPQKGPYEGGYGVQQEQLAPPQTAPYGGYGYQPPYPQQGYGMPQSQYPGSAAQSIPSYGYTQPPVPSFQFRPLEKKEAPQRYRGDYPQLEYGYPGSPQPGHDPQR